MTTPKKTVKRAPRPLPILLLGLTWVVCALAFPLYRIWDYLLVAAVSVLVYKVSSIMAEGLDLSPKSAQVILLEEEPPSTGNPLADEVLSQGQAMLDTIRHENDLIPDAKLSYQLEELERIGRQILATVRDTPEKAPLVRRFLNYYLPTTLKMVASYRRMDERQVTGQNATEAKNRITSAMEVVVRAFEKQLDTLYHGEMMDITTDIDVLESMLAKEGVAVRGYPVLPPSDHKDE